MTISNTTTSEWTEITLLKKAHVQARLKLENKLLGDSEDVWEKEQWSGGTKI